MEITTAATNRLKHLHDDDINPEDTEPVAWY